MTEGGHRYERMIGIFLLGCVLFCYPMLSIFSAGSLVFGIPLLFVYLFCVWLGLIVLIYLATRDRPPSEAPEASPSPAPLSDHGSD